MFSLIISSIILCLSHDGRNYASLGNAREMWLSFGAGWNVSIISDFFKYLYKSLTELFQEIISKKKTHDSLTMYQAVLTLLILL